MHIGKKDKKSLSFLGKLIFLLKINGRIRGTSVTAAQQIITIRVEYLIVIFQIHPHRTPT